jgi:hypothetical protein
MKKIVLALSVLLSTLGTAQAQNYTPAPAPTRFLLGMGLSGGGDKLASARYEDGDTVNIHAGGLIYFTAGADFHVTPEFSLQGTVNYHVDRANARNPLWRVGGGVRYASSPKLSGSGAGSGLEASFDSSTGAVVEGEYFTSPKLGIKLRYVHETYKERGFGDIDGSHVGLSANFYF